MEGLTSGEYSALGKRHLSEETCKHFGYQVGDFNDKKVQIANYRNADNEIVSQKLRFANKDFTWCGSAKAALPLYGQWLWRDGGKMVVVTEGEIDALSVSQLQGNKWPVVSVKNGAQGAAKNIADALEWLEQFDTVVFMFDNDEPGNKAARECALLLTPGKGKVAQLPLKDANDMLVEGRGAEVINAIWNAKVYRPEGIVTLDDIEADILEEQTIGLPWWLPSLTELTFGRRYGELLCLGAGTGVGKTDFIVQQIAYDLMTLKLPVGLFMFEQQPVETARRIAGKYAGKHYHIPGDWTKEQLMSDIAAVKASATPYFFNHFGTAEWDIVEKRIRFLAHSAGVKLFYIDNLTALVASEDSEKEGLERIMASAGGLVKELDINILLISHLSTPEGKSHEEGGRVSIKHFKGSRTIGFWSHYMFGMERDQQAEDEQERTVTTFRILKARYAGAATGKTLYLSYEQSTGRLFETSLDAFADETSTPTAPKGNDDF